MIFMILFYPHYPPNPSELFQPLKRGSASFRSWAQEYSNGATTHIFTLDLWKPGRFSHGKSTFLWVRPIFKNTPKLLESSSNMRGFQPISAGRIQKGTSSYSIQPPCGSWASRAARAEVKRSCWTNGRTTGRRVVHVLLVQCSLNTFKHYV